MLQSSAFGRSLVALALCSAAFAFSVTPAPARSHHSARRYAHAHNTARRHYAYRHYRHVARISRWDAGVAQMQAHGLADTNASLPSSAASGMSMSGGFGASNVVAEARRYIGGNPTSRGTLWCARFMNMVLQRSGYHGTGSDPARWFASYGQPVSGPHIGAISVMGRRRRRHAPQVRGIPAQRNPTPASRKNPTPS